jgi:tetratricopeptide (TPR) repeat protein
MKIAVALILSLALLPVAFGQEDEATLIKKGDVFDRKIQPAEALELYLAAEKLKPDHVPLMLRIARQYRHRAAEVTSTEEKIRLSEIGKDYAVRAVLLAPDDPETHLSLAISNAKLVPLLGSREKLEASKAVKSAVDKSLALDPGQDLAWHVLGAWHQRLTEIGPVKRAAAKVLYGEIPEGSSEEAVACFQKAIKLNPNRLSHHIELGLAYAALGKNAEARAALEKGLSMPSVDAGDPDSKRRAREALPKIE